MPWANAVSHVPLPLELPPLARYRRSLYYSSLYTTARYTTGLSSKAISGNIPSWLTSATSRLTLLNLGVVTSVLVRDC